MQDHDFTSRSRSGEPYYYVFIKGDAPVGRIESRFFRFGTALEAAALYRFLETVSPELDITLGIHKDYTRRADIIERIDGTNVLSDSFTTTSPWGSDSAVAKDAGDLAIRMDVLWKIDRELVGHPILIPNEREWKCMPSFLEGKALRPDTPGDPKSSIREGNVRGLGWLSLDGLKSYAANCNHGASPKPPLVGDLLVDCQAVDEKSFGSLTMTPGEYRRLEAQYLAQQHEKETPHPPRPSSQPLGDLKQEAKTRAQSHLRPVNPTKPIKPFDHAL